MYDTLRVGNMVRLRVPKKKVPEHRPGSFNVLICFVSLAGGLFEIRSSCEEIFWHRSKADVRSGPNRQRPTLFA
jgi:hypothetical protein